MELVTSGLFIYASIYFLNIYSDTYLIYRPPPYVVYREIDVGVFGLLLLSLAIITLFLLAVPTRNTKRGLTRLMKFNYLSVALICIMEFQNYIVWNNLNVSDIILITIALIPAVIIQYWLYHNKSNYQKNGTP
jgi:hypothetical protein